VGEDHVVGRHKDEYLDIAGDGRVDEGVGLCLDLLDRGVCPEDIALGLLEPAQHEVGQRWALGTWAVAQEHAASAVTDAALAALDAAVPAPTRGAPLVVACPRTEWHGLAARMVTQILRWRGVAADYVGTLASDAAVHELLTSGRPRALALSCTMTSALPEVARAVDIAARHKTTVLGGGRGFGPHGRYARAVGISTWVASAAEVAARLARGDGAGWPAHHRPVPEPLVYRRLARHRRDIAEEVAARVLDDEAGAEESEMIRDAAEQIAAVALASARTGHASILDDGVGELVAVLNARPEPLCGVAARLPGAAHAVVDRYRDSH
jgi:methanogenic corrinoid protein MtbC1